MEDLNDDNRITLWMAAEEYIESSYGRITYEEWCKRERLRIARSGEHLRIVRRTDGTIAIFRCSSSRPDAVGEAEQLTSSRGSRSDETG